MIESVKCHPLFRISNQILTILFYLVWTLAQAQEKVFPGADAKTPSKSQYFSWINHTNEGPTEAQTRANLDFFKWLRDSYGMQLDIYAFDAGAWDGRNFYGHQYPDRFRKSFPNGFDKVYEQAKSIKTRLGIWGGPDGFGDTETSEKERTDFMVSLCRDYDFALFKFDGVCGFLRPEKQSAFARMMTMCRQYSPDLIALNHRLDLGELGMPHATTTLLSGAETYIDVHMANEVTAPHHRVGALSRGLTPGLNRLTEDHGVCISSCLDYWEDDLVLQAFNRNLILAPQIYGNPWLLRDDEYPLLARIFNLHRKHRDILVDGLVLPEEIYGPNAVSRGDNHTRLITLRNLSWEPIKIPVTVDSTIGLLSNGNAVTVRQYHPTEKVFENHKYGTEFSIEVQPFRSCLVKISNQKDNEEWGITGTDFRVISDGAGDTTRVKLLARPGALKNIKFNGDAKLFSKAVLNGESISYILKGESQQIRFSGDSARYNYHRKLMDLKGCPVPEDAFSLYEATQFAADNNSLEARSLQRSGESKIPQVRAARTAFFEQPMFRQRETWDNYLFDGDFDTAFSVSTRYEAYHPLRSALRIDLGKTTPLDSLLLHVADEIALQPYKSGEVEYVMVSNDLKQWESVPFLTGTKMRIGFKDRQQVRYLRFPYSMQRLQEVQGFYDGKILNRSSWRASNLQAPYVFDWHWDKTQHYFAQKAWNAKVILDEIPKGSYLCVAINGEHGVEGAVAAFKVDGKYVGCADRSPSYQSNTWEYRVVKSDKNYTYYLPLSADMKGKSIEAFVLAFDGRKTNLRPQLWITAYPAPYAEKMLTLIRK